jgi:hypothetical protein
MNKTRFNLGLAVGLAAGVALYFAVVWLLPLAGKAKWIIL